jgi:hypothetical protein
MRKEIEDEDDEDEDLPGPGSPGRAGMREMN